MKFHSPAIFVKDIEKSKNFYIRLLKQKIEHDFGKNVIFEDGLTIWEISPEHIISKRLKTDTKTNNFELYFETNSLDETYKELKEEGIEFLHAIHEEPWGQRTIRFFDYDKHLIEIGEPMETFVMNMNKKGLSENQIAEKSGIAIEVVKQILQDHN